MKEDVVVRLAVWLVERSGDGPVAEALAGDLLESFANGQSRWWCFVQAVRRLAGVTELRVRAFLVPALYCAAFVLLHPLWRRWNAHFAARVQTMAAWPGAAVLEIAEGLLPAVLFVWMGVLIYLLLQPRSSQRIDPTRALLALSFGSCVVSAETMLRLGHFQHNLHALSRADFYYPLFHAHFSAPLFVGLFAAVALLPRLRPDDYRRHARRLPGRPTLLSIVRGFGTMTLLVPQTTAQTHQPQVLRRSN